MEDYLSQINLKRVGEDVYYFPIVCAHILSWYARLYCTKYIDSVPLQTRIYIHIYISVYTPDLSSHMKVLLIKRSDSELPLLKADSDVYSSTPLSRTTMQEMGFRSDIA